MATTAETGTVARRRSRFFANAAIAVAAAIVLSFVPTYFVPMAGGGGFNMLRHVHGLAFFGWVVLYVWQANLVPAGRVRLHRELGLATVALSAAMIPLGFWMATAEIEEKLAEHAARPFEIAAYNFFDLAMFALAMGAATWFAPRRIEWHRRLIYVAALFLLGPALSRWLDYVPAGVPYPIYDALPNFTAALFLVPLALYDRRSLGRLHPVTLGALLVLVPWSVVEALISRTAWWNALAPHLFGFA